MGSQDDRSGNEGAVVEDAETDEPGEAATQGVPAPPADFNTLVLSLSTSALMYMGLVHGPEGAVGEKNLVMAKHTIDLIGLLEQKTQGNLTGEEERLIAQVLYDLRLHFVGVAKS